MLWRRALAETTGPPRTQGAIQRDLRRSSARSARRRCAGIIWPIFPPLDKLWQRGGKSEWRMANRGRRKSPYSLFATRYSPQRPWDIPEPPSPQLKALAGQGGLNRSVERRERMIVLTMINHPELIHEFLDEFAAVELQARELDSIRSQIIDSAALGSGLDGPGLRAHLLDRGLGPLLDRLETQARRLNDWFLGSGAAHDDARTGLRQMIALHRKTVTLERELKAAEAVFAADPTEENLDALNAVREQLSSHAGSEATIEGFGAASGRPADAIT
jgi:DNA primase